MAVPTEEAANHDIRTTILITLHCHKLHRGTLDFGLGEESSHVFAGDNVMNGTIFVSVTDYNGRTIIQGPGSCSHLKINKGQIKKVYGTINKSQSFLPVDAGSITVLQITQTLEIVKLNLDLYDYNLNLAMLLTPLTL